MIIALLFQLTLATNYLLFGQKYVADNDVSKKIYPFNLVVFDSDTFTIYKSLIIPANATVLNCNFDKNYNIYYTTFDNDAFFNFLEIQQQKVSIIKESTTSIIINKENDVFIMTKTRGVLQISQVNWPNFTNVFTFNSSFANSIMFDASLYIPSKNLYLFSGSLKNNEEYYFAIIVMTYTGNFEIVNIFPIEYQMGSISYYNNTIYIFVYGQRSIELCSINLDSNGTINYLTKYDTILKYIYKSTIVGDNLYLIARTEKYGQFYWINTNLVNLTLTMRKLPTDLNIGCIVPFNL